MPMCAMLCSYKLTLLCVLKGRTSCRKAWIWLTRGIFRVRRCSSCSSNSRRATHLPSECNQPTPGSSTCHKTCSAASMIACVSWQPCAACRMHLNCISTTNCWRCLTCRTVDDAMCWLSCDKASRTTLLQMLGCNRLLCATCSYAILARSGPAMHLKVGTRT